ncbi:M10 family metallopeptidase C-terminal domain-containing protein [Roseomonas sp. WA12]
MDVKTTYADGSVKMAVLSLARPELTAGETVEVVLNRGSGSVAAPAVNMKAAILSHSFVVDMHVAGKPAIQIDVMAELQQALADGTASFWQKGPLASQARVEVLLEGAQRLVFDVTAFKDGTISVDAQFNNDRAMEVSGGRVKYTVTAELDGKTVLDETVNQGQYQNWHREFVSGGANGGQGLGSPKEGWLNIQHDVARLGAIGAVADYDLTLDIPESTFARYEKEMADKSWGDPLANNGVTKYMPTAGSRDDIGIVTHGNSSWLISQDARAAEYAMGQAEAAGSVPWNFRDVANDAWLNPSDYPKLWMDVRGGVGKPGDANSKGPTQLADDLTGWGADRAHQPELSFVPYVLTGERWILDNLQAQASFNLVSVWTAQRGADANVIVNNQQVRTMAWGLREIENALWATPDNSPDKAWLKAASDSNWKWLVSKIPEWTKTQGEAHGYLPTNTSVNVAPWQQDFFASTIISAASRGNADALTYLNWAKNFLIGRFQHGEDGFPMHDGLAYRIQVLDPATGKPYATWAELGAGNIAAGNSNGEGWATSEGYYGRLAMATLAGIYELTGDKAAADAYFTLAADSPPNASADSYARDPQYAVTIPGIYGGTVAGTAADDVRHLTNPSPKLVVNLGGGEDLVILADGGNTGTISNTETIIGGSGNDNITLATTLVGGRIDLKGGTDRLTLADGRNMVEVSGTETIIGGAGEDYVRLGNAGGTVTVSGVEVLVGGDGDDIVTLNGLTDGVSVNLGGGTNSLTFNPAAAVGAPAARPGAAPAPTRVGNVQNLTGSNGADSVILTTAVVGASIDLRNGADRLQLSDSGPNSVTLRNVETVIGGGADDTVTFADTVRGVAVDLGGGNDRLILADGKNQVTVSGIERIRGGSSSDQVTFGGSDAPATIDLGNGTDRLTLAGSGRNDVTVHNTETIVGGVADDNVTLGTVLDGGNVNLGGGTNRLSLSSKGANTGQVGNVSVLTGGSAADAVTMTTVLTGAEIDLGAGADSLVLFSGNNSARVWNTESITGGGGADSITLGSAVNGIRVDLRLGTDTLTLSSAGPNVLSVLNVETLLGGSADDTVQLEAASAGMTVDLGGGNDRLTLFASTTNVLTVHKVETIIGGGLSDTVTLGGAVAGITVDLGKGADRLLLSSAGSNNLVVSNVETITGGSNADTVVFGSMVTDAVVDLGAGQDRLELSSSGANSVTVRGVETIIGGKQADTVVLSAAMTGGTVDLGEGADRLVLYSSANDLVVSNVETIIGGAQTDWVTLGSAVSDALVDLGVGEDRLQLSSAGKNVVTVRNTEMITGGSKADQVKLEGSVNNVSLDLGKGDDRLILASTGPARVVVQNAETIIGSSASEFVRLDGAVDDIVVNLGGGTDMLTLSSAGPNRLTVNAIETIIGGTAADTVTLSGAAKDVVIDLGGGADRVELFSGTNSVTLRNVETVIGGAGDDEVKLGTAITQGVIDLGAGTDKLVLSSAGANTLTVSNVETIIGGVPTDRVTLATASQGGNFDLGASLDRLELSSSGPNSVTVTNIELVVGGSAADQVTVRGNTGAVLEGRGGNDVLTGSGGADTLIGGAGQDRLTGGKGADVFLFNFASESSVKAPDWITDFQAGTDKLAFVGLLKGGFDYLEGSAFSSGGHTEARLDAATKVLQLDFDGDGRTDLALNMQGSSLSSLSEKDFVWS